MRNYENVQRRKVAFWVILSCESSFYCTGALQNIVRAKRTTDEEIMTHIINNNRVIGEYIVVFAGHNAFKIKKKVCWSVEGLQALQTRKLDSVQRRVEVQAQLRPYLVCTNVASSRSMALSTLMLPMFVLFILFVSSTWITTN